MRTRTIFRILLFTFFLQSCTVCTFDKPFPGKSKSLHSFPKKMRGNWKAAAVSTDFPITEFSLSKDSLLISFAGTSKPSCLRIKNDSVQFRAHKNFFSLHLLSEHGWLMYRVDLNGDEIEIQEVDKRSMQIVKKYEVYNLPNKLTVIKLLPEKEEWGQVLQYGLTPPHIFKRSQ